MFENFLKEQHKVRRTSTPRPLGQGWWARGAWHGGQRPEELWCLKMPTSLIMRASWHTLLWGTVPRVWNMKEERWGQGKEVDKVRSDEGRGTRSEGRRVTSRAWKRRGWHRLTPGKNKEERPENGGNTLPQIQPLRVLQHLDGTGSFTEASVARSGATDPRQPTLSPTRSYTSWIHACLSEKICVCLRWLIWSEPFIHI